MKSDETKGTFKIIVDGLAIVCFNEEENQCEIGLLREEHHNLTLELEKKKHSDKGSETVEFIENPSRNDTTIEITACDESPKRITKFTTGDFDRRKNSSNPEDIRWLVDIEDKKFYPKGVKPTKTAENNNIPLSGLIIKNNGLFYTDSFAADDKKTPQTYYSFSEKNGTMKRIGRIGKSLGVSIDSEKVEITVRENKKIIFQQVCSKSDNLEYIFTIKNERPAEFDGKGRTGDDVPDMPFYHKVFSPNEADVLNVIPTDMREKFSTEFKKKNKTDKGELESISAKTACHVLLLGQTKTLAEFK